MLAKVLLLLTVVLAASAFGLWRVRQDGRVRGVGSAPADRSGPGGTRLCLSPADLGAPLGARATLVQFSTTFCQPCRVARRVLSEVASQVEGVTHVEIDAERHLDLVRRLDVRRTPTVLVLDPEGWVVSRAVGAPRPADVMAALGETVP